MMTAFHVSVPASCLALLLTSTSAFADVTAQQVWDDWKSMLGLYGEVGEEVTVGSENYANGVLTVTDLTVNLDDDDGTRVTASLAELLLTEQGDGTVAVTFSETMPLRVIGTDDEGQSMDLTMTLAYLGADMIVSGEPAEMVYDVEIARAEFRIDEIITDGEVMPLEAVVGLNNLIGTYTTSVSGELRNIVYDLATETADLKFAGQDADSGGTVTISGGINALASAMDMTIPVDADMMEGDEIFARGFDMTGSQSFGATDLTFLVNENGAMTEGTFRISGGEGHAVMNQGALEYAFGLGGMSAEMSGTEMPFPVSFSTDEISFNLGMPLSPTDTPADFAFGLTLAGLAVNEEIWSMVDPGAVLPRDPATVNLDLTGTATLLVSLLDPDVEEMEEAPGLIHSLDINDITLIFGGADVNATGAFTFDNNDMTTFPGMPRPTGKVDIALNGLNGLLQKLVQIGAVPAEQVAMVPMMLGMFTRPVGDDQLTSTIEFTADGQLLANGQRLQ